MKPPQPNTVGSLRFQTTSANKTENRPGHSNSIHQATGQTIMSNQRQTPQPQGYTTYQGAVASARPGVVPLAEPTAKFVQPSPYKNAF